MIKSFATLLSVICITIDSASASARSDGATSGMAADRERLGELIADKFKHVVVISDIRGNSEMFLASLYGAMSVVESGIEPAVRFDQFKELFNRAINGDVLEGVVPLASPAVGEVALIQLGDLVGGDAGPESMIQCMDIALKFQTVIGWTVLLLQGDHELMLTLNRKSNYTGVDDFGKFGVDRMRTAVVERMGKIGLAVAKVAGGHGDMAPGDMRNPNTLFAHGGIFYPWFSLTMGRGNQDVCNINYLFQLTVERDPSVGLWTTHDSPIASSYYGYSGDHLCEGIIRPALHYFNVARIVVGHMPLLAESGRGAMTFCNGQLIVTGGSSDDAAGYQGSAVIMTMDHRSRDKLSRIDRYAWSIAGVIEDTQPIWSASEGPASAGQDDRIWT